MIRNAIGRVFIVPLSAAALVFGFAFDLRAAPATDPNTIVLKNFHFAPASLTVTPGTTVTWQNLDGEPHTVVSSDGLFRSGGLDQNDVFTFAFDTPGTYKFLCSIHPHMTGTIVVK
jgi:plastocyanin